MHIDVLQQVTDILPSVHIDFKIHRPGKTSVFIKRS